MKMHLRSLASSKTRVPGSRFGLFVQVILFLRFACEVLAINAGQLGIQINPGLASKGKYAYNAIAQFQDDILATW